MILFEIVSIFKKHLLWLVLCIWLCGVPAWAGQQSSNVECQDDVIDLSLEDLLNVEITSVSKKRQLLSDAPAAIFVISSDDLRRSGATSIPEALRMVPGINVARIDSNKWAITSRGFNGRFANKLLVVIDGRTVYSPSFSDVYWEVQDTMLEDVERIEIIRGPGATLWGANAVNGVINIITKHAADTQGGILALGGGNKEQAFGGARYGMSLGETTYGRIYVKGFKRDEFVHTEGGDAGDDWNILRRGFRVDSFLSSRDALTVQGDFYKGHTNQALALVTTTAPFSQLVKDEVDVSGWNLIGRWHRVLSSESEFTLQLYYDRSDRDDVLLGEVRDTLDIDFQHRFAAGERNDIIWGLQYRYTSDDYTNSSMMTIIPDGSSDDRFSAFVQDEITLIENRLWLTLGSKFEHSYFSATKLELQPNIRLLWTPRPKHKLWAAVSRAVRTPSRAERDVRLVLKAIPPLSPANPGSLPIVGTAIGNSDYDSSEELIAYELGYRIVPHKSLSFDLSAFYCEYDNLRGFKGEPPSFQGTYIEQAQRFKNMREVETYGFELAGLWQITDLCRVDMAYSYYKTRKDTRELLDRTQNSDAPKHQVSLRAAVNLRQDLDLDIWLRYVDEIKTFYALSMADLDIDSYLTLDARLAWRPCDNLEISVVGQNLLDDKHPEYLQESYTMPTEIERSLYGKITWRF
jgi:iron complex outermembrane receptor protein